MSKAYVRLYNVFTEDGEHKLSPRELYFYALLVSLKSVFRGYCLTTLNLICQYQIVFKDNNESRNINECRKIILSLAKKKVIEIESDLNMRANTPLKITFPVFKGFEDINLEFWENVSSPDELMVLILLKRINGYEKAKDQWSKILGYSSKNTGNEIVTRMETEDKIYSVQGDLYTDAQGRVKQHPTKWYIGKKPEKKEDVKQDVVNETLSVPDNTGDVWGNWKGSGNLTDSDYLIYAKQENNVEFMKVAEAKINRITKNGNNDKAVYMINQQIEKSKEELTHIKKKEQRENIKKSKSELIHKYGVCIELKDGSIVSHREVVDWSEAKNFIFVNKEGEVASSSIKGKHPIYEAVLSRYEYIDQKALWDEIRPYISGEKKIDGVEEVKIEEEQHYEYYYR